MLDSFFSPSYNLNSLKRKVSRHQHDGIDLSYFGYYVFYVSVANLADFSIFLGIAK